MNLTVLINHHTDSIYADDLVLVFSPVLGNTMLVKILERVMASGGSHGAW